MKYFLFLILLLFFISQNSIANVPIFNYFNNEESVNIEFRYSDYKFSKIINGENIKEISISSGANFDNINYGFALSKSVNPEYSKLKNNDKDIYHFYNSLGISNKINEYIFLLGRLNFDLNSLKEINISTDAGFGGKLFQINGFSKVDYSFLLEFYYGDVDTLKLTYRIIKGTIILPLYYFNLGFSYNYYLDTHQRDYFIFININKIIENHF